MIAISHQHAGLLPAEQNIAKIKAGAALLLALLGFLQPTAVSGVGPDPTGAPALDTWTFSDAGWLTDFGRSPVSYTNLVNVPDLGDGNCLLLDSPESAWLQYPINDQGTNLLTVDCGSVAVWFATSGGTNSDGSRRPIIEVGSYTEDASYGWWGLFFDG